MLTTLLDGLLCLLAVAFVALLTYTGSLALISAFIVLLWFSGADGLSLHTAWTASAILAGTVLIGLAVVCFWRVWRPR